MKKKVGAYNFRTFKQILVLLLLLTIFNVHELTLIFEILFFFFIFSYENLKEFVINQMNIKIKKKKKQFVNMN